MSDRTTDGSMDLSAPQEDSCATAESAPSEAARAPAAAVSRPIARERSTWKSIRADEHIEWQRVLDSTLPCRIRAEVDFIDFDLRLRSPTQLRALLPLCPTGSNSPRNVRLSGNVVQDVTLRIQDPSPYLCQKTLSRINARFPFEVEPRISAIEVSMDFYLTGADLDQMGRLAARLYHFAKHKPSAPSRIKTIGFRPNESATRAPKIRMPSRLMDLISTMQTGEYSTYIGFQDSRVNSPSHPISLRFYPKRTDQKAVLPAEQQRARMEVKLQGAALPFATLDAAAEFDFTRLARHFKFWMVPDETDLTSFQKLRYCQLAGIDRPSRKLQLPPGLPRIDRRSSRVLFSDDDLNKRTHTALRTLTGRWARPGT